MVECYFRKGTLLKIIRKGLGLHGPLLLHFSSCKLVNNLEKDGTSIFEIFDILALVNIISVGNFGSCEGRWPAVLVHIEGCSGGIGTLYSTSFYRSKTSSVSLDTLYFRVDYLIQLVQK